MSHHHHARRALAAMPTTLREVLYDDALFVAEGKFRQPPSPISWPGGLYRDTVTLCNNLQVGEPLTQVTLPVFRVTGQPAEGFDICGAQEDTGPVELWLRALQGPNQAWQKVLDFLGSTIFCLVYQGGAPGDFGPAVFAANGAPAGHATQSYFNRMQDYLLTVRNLPPGAYQPRLVKKPNAAAGDESTGDRGTYLDLLRVFTYAS